MKYVIEFSLAPPASLTISSLPPPTRRSIRLASGRPEEGLTVHAFVGSLNGVSIYSLVETADPAVVLSFVSKFTPWSDIEVVPVVDVAEGITTINESQGVGPLCVERLSHSPSSDEVGSQMAVPHRWRGLSEASAA